ncbi:MAG: quinone-dependent dihydroorotate dehydrogenase, partial [Natronosporangium sp.]
MLFERALRPYLFRLGDGDAETAHEWTLRRLSRLARRPGALATLRRRYAVEAPRTVFGVRFPNPVGLAAGMDKDATALAAWPALGFGFVEVGTVTWHPQPGSERPRLQRLPDSEALLNRMGFNNRGARALADRLAVRGRPPVPLGISLGKSRATELADSVEDYLASYRVLREHADYFAVNVSSPNTPGLRSLQDRDQLDALLAALVGEKPVLVKIAPDLTDQAIGELLQVCTDRGAAGVIATNTTIARDGLAAADQQ